MALVKTSIFREHFFPPPPFEEQYIQECKVFHLQVDTNVSIDFQYIIELFFLKPQDNNKPLPTLCKVQLHKQAR